MKKTRLIKTIETLEAAVNLIEKCGGPGGKPGPCPKPKPAEGGESKPPKMNAAQLTEKFKHWSPQGSAEAVRKSLKALGPTDPSSPVLRNSSEAANIGTLSAKTTVGAAKIVKALKDDGWASEPGKNDTGLSQYMTKENNLVRIVELPDKSAKVFTPPIVGYALNVHGVKGVLRPEKPPKKPIPAYIGSNTPVIPHPKPKPGTPPYHGIGGVSKYD